MLGSFTKDVAAVCRDETKHMKGIQMTEERREQKIINATEWEPSCRRAISPSPPLRVIAGIMSGPKRQCTPSGTHLLVPPPVAPYHVLFPWTFLISLSTLYLPLYHSPFLSSPPWHYPISRPAPSSFPFPSCSSTCFMFDLYPSPAICPSLPVSLALSFSPS